MDAESLAVGAGRAADGAVDVPSWGCLLGGSSALLITAGAFGAAGHHKKAAAGHHKKAAPEEKFDVKFHTWTVSIGGHTQNVAVGSTVKYSASAPVESITPDWTVNAAKSGKHVYSYRLKGPGRQVTGVTEASFAGRAVVVRPPYVPLALALGGHGDTRGEHSTFTPGAYQLEVRVGSPEHISFYGEGRGKPALVVGLKLEQD